MIRKALLFAVAACLSAPLGAQQSTKKYDYKPVDSLQDISLSVEKVKVNQIVFHSGKAVGGPSRRSDLECVVRIDNEGAVDVQAGIAVAVFDEGGNIVAAGSGGTRVGWVKAGQRDTAAIRFPFVYRNMDKAKTFIVTLEVQPKAAKDTAPESTP